MNMTNKHSEPYQIRWRVTLEHGILAFHAWLRVSRNDLHLGGPVELVLDDRADVAERRQRVPAGLHFASTAHAMAFALSSQGVD